MAAITNPILLDSTGQEIVEALETIAENMGTSAGHTIQNDSGTDMQRRDKLQFKGTYVEDDQTNNKTVVNVTRQMTLAEFNQLTSEQKKGIIDVTDQQGHPITASDIPYDSNNTVKDKIDENELHLTSEKSIVISSSITAGAEIFLGYAGSIAPELAGHNVLGVQLRDVSDGNVHCLYMNSNGLFDRCALSKSSLSIKIRFLYND